MGLMGRPGLADGAGLWLTGTNGIHMMFMRFPIDAVFLGGPIRRARTAARPVLSVHAACAPWTGLVPLVRGARGRLELPVGAIARTGRWSATASLLEPAAAALTGSARVIAGEGRRPSSPCEHDRVASPGCTRSRLARGMRGLRARGRGHVPAACPALDARLELPGGTPDRIAGRPPGAASSARVVRRVHRSCPGRAASAEVRERATARRTPRWGSRASVGARRGRVRTWSCRYRSTPTASASAATTRRP